MANIEDIYSGGPIKKKIHKHTNKNLQQKRQKTNNHKQKSKQLEITLYDKESCRISETGLFRLI